MMAVFDVIERLKGHRVYFDTNTLIFFFDRNPTYFPAVAELIKACDRGDFFGFTGDAAVCELMVHPYKTANPAEIARGKAFFARENFITVLAHNSAVFDTTARIRAEEKLKMIDALNYATALSVGCTFFITHDKDFNAIESSDRMRVVRLADCL